MCIRDRSCGNISTNCNCNTGNDDTMSITSSATTGACERATTTVRKPQPHDTNGGAHTST
eukprot:6337433-Alexandrium_andersonii.AAC.1